MRGVLQGGVVQLRFVIVGPSGSGLIPCVVEEGGGQEKVRERGERDGAIKPAPPIHLHKDLRILNNITYE